MIVQKAYSTEPSLIRIKEIPIKEITEASDDFIRSPKVCYIGTNSTSALEILKAQIHRREACMDQICDYENLCKLVQHQEERKMIPYSLDAGTADIPWSTLTMI